MRFYVRRDQPGRQPVPAVQTQNLVVKATGKIAIKNNQWFIRDVVHSQSAPFRQPVHLGQDHNELLFVEQFTVQGDVIERWSQEADVNVVPAQRLILKVGKNVAAFN